MKRKIAVSAAILVALGLGAWYGFAPSHTPAPQPPLVALNSGNFQASFYGALRTSPQDAHLLLLLSPT